jgi:hypothetical protein
LLLAAEARDLACWADGDCAAVYGAPAKTTMPKITHPTGNARTFRYDAIDPLLWILREEKSIIVHTVEGTGNECEFSISAPTLPLPRFFRWPGPMHCTKMRETL